jgi:hypothetical protein
MVKEFYASCLALSHMSVGGNRVASVSFGIRFVPDFTILGVSSQQVTIAYNAGQYTHAAFESERKYH